MPSQLKKYLDIIVKSSYLPPSFFCEFFHPCTEADGTFKPCFLVSTSCLCTDSRLKNTDPHTNITFIVNHQMCETSFSIIAPCIYPGHCLMDLGNSCLLPERILIQGSVKSNTKSNSKVWQSETQRLLLCENISLLLCRLYCVQI